MPHPIRTSAPAKIILFGEHAVVHGQPAIAVPLHAIQATAEATAAPPGSGLVLHALDTNRTLTIQPDGMSAIDPDHDPVSAALAYPVQLTLRALGCPPPDLHITVRSTIPIASGLGSGAALATVLARALCLALDRPLSNDELNPIIFEVEKHHHGTPSGIDNTVIVYEQPVFFEQGRPLEPITIAQPFTLVVADTGISSPTRHTVADVGALYRTELARIGTVFSRIGSLAREARTAIESGTIQILGALMNENHALLQTLTVSSAELDTLCAAARANGALGAKLSGGGRGGNMIALTEPQHSADVAAALVRAGATRTLITTVQ